MTDDIKCANIMERENLAMLAEDEKPINFPELYNICGDESGSFDDLLSNYIETSNLMDDSDLTDFKVNISNQPMSQTGPPPRGDFGGDFNFEVNLSSETSNRKKCVYSLELNRVFLSMMAEMAVQFVWDWEALGERQVWVRATPILARSEQQEARVRRCFNHRVPEDASNRGIFPDIIPHVLRSARQGLDVQYCGLDEHQDSWLSVALKAPQRPPNGVTHLQHVYLFCCKHSCTSGINRRPIEVLFTLEDSMGTVLGRRSLGVRVCSCPRRDMEKEEKEFHLSSGGPPPRKRAMLRAPPKPQTNLPVKNDVDLCLHALYNVGYLALRNLPADNPAIPLLQTLNQEVQRQINQQP